MRLGLIGYPLSHTLSPAMHAAALEALGLAGSYAALETPPEALAERMDEVRRAYRGVNVTVPHKEAVMPYLDRLSPEAEAIGAVNTVVNREGRLEGHNTDAPGFLRGLEEAGIEYRGAKALILGAGGAARAIAWALKQAGAQVRIGNRTLERAAQLQREFGLGEVTDNELVLAGMARSSDLIVNTTTVGLKDPAATPLRAEWLPAGGTVVDIVYNPLETRLLREARAAGLRTLGGLPMLVWQGALAFELWTGQRPPVEVMYQAARGKLEA
ncbi:Shikimate dehydrogenase (NADP(+)) [Calidithermus terrae]|uniref:Shikimate dehydrogenase (NADP(+)) n=1 Tax=Calidithermus terrae TaxID=1408545 RepID=A0A399EAS9_9DEIN|nr:shikimate dehydrogenase [Calidithermus terrae]RIH79172.1 Shikimate dehydrogenase (NADP(+)) [Calidithermus terrae]